MKKFLCILLAVLCFSQVCAFAEENINVTVKGKAVEFDVPPQSINDRTMVPMRKIFEALGANVEWVEQAQLIIATKNSNIIAMEIGKEVFSVSNVITGETKNITLDVPPQVVNDRTLVPVRAISESLGLSVEWNEESNTVIIN